MQPGRFLRPLARLGRKIVFHIPCFGVRMWAEIHLRTTPVLLRGEYLPRRMDKNYRPIHRRDQQIFRKWRLECSRSRFTAPRSSSHVRILVYTPGRVAGCVSRPFFIALQDIPPNRGVCMKSGKKEIPIQYQEYHTYGRDGKSPIIVSSGIGCLEATF